jgi:hypothetical protein
MIGMSASTDAVIPVRFAQARIKDQLVPGTPYTKWAPFQIELKYN